MTDGLFRLETASFKAEKGSVLHSGIYNRELASSLAAGAGVMLLGFFFAVAATVTAVHYLGALLVFVALFLFFRTFVFRDPVLTTVIDKERGGVTISVPKPFGEKSVSFPLVSLAAIRQDCRREAPENPDGVRIVEQISAQHGTVIPGFGRTAEFYTVEVELHDGRRWVVFSSEDPSAAEDVASKMKLYIER